MKFEIRMATPGTIYGVVIHENIMTQCGNFLVEGDLVADACADYRLICQQLPQIHVAAVASLVAVAALREAWNFPRGEKAKQLANGAG